MRTPVGGCTVRVHTSDNHTASRDERRALRCHVSVLPNGGVRAGAQLLRRFVHPLLEVRASRRELRDRVDERCQPAH